MIYCTSKDLLFPLAVQFPCLRLLGGDLEVN